MAQFSRTIRVLPTASGGVFVLVVVALTLAAINYSNNVLYALAFLLAAGGSGSAWAAWRELGRLRLGELRLQPAFAGEPLRCEVCVTEQADRERFALRLVRGALRGEACALPRRETLALRLDVAAAQRGPVTVDRLAVASVFPLGLFQAARRLEGAAGTLVYPAPEPRSAAQHGLRRNAAHLVAESDSFSHIRPYVPGDHPTRIHWRAFARADVLAVKVFDGGRGGAAIWIDWRDAGCATVEDVGEAALSRMCRWVLDAHDAGLTFGFRLPDTEFPPAAGTGQRDRCLAALALYRPPQPAPARRRWPMLRPAAAGAGT